MNEPGEGHNRLVSMGREASKAVFEPATRLHDEGDRGDNLSSCSLVAGSKTATRLHDEGDRGDNLSSGDGAWIMQKCAKNLGGTCDIVFEEHQTKFSVECQASPHYNSDDAKASMFELPADTWAIGLDDSVSRFC